MANLWLDSFCLLVYAARLYVTGTVGLQCQEGGQIDAIEQPESSVANGCNLNNRIQEPPPSSFISALGTKAVKPPQLQKMADKNAKINAKMARVCPELASEYARYPLQMKSWVSPDAMGPNKNPCWISAPRGTTERKDDYAFGAGKKGWGYYHLLTRDSYTILYARLTNEMPGCCCAFSAEARRQMSDWDDVKTIVYNRSVATIPDDAQAKKDAIRLAQGVAQAHYHEGQNFQLAVGVATTAATGF
ncbi:expressed unknown protein [Seminavis robusta]|uniref:Uncharacterized protein n=1 Tax=Seminavis robusta TaxID=568900 RepID=A0A9N8DI16_9STRA|nr:expressed unknown protein [Seminavis robusta]|eukprot:Sro75_g041160.1 n/a (246) ;mRNA; f:52425-53309